MKGGGLEVTVTVIAVDGGDRRETEQWKECEYELIHSAHALS